MKLEYYKHFISTFKKCTQESKPLNSKIFVGVAVGGLAIVLAVIAFSGTLISDVSDGAFSPFQEPEVLPLGIEFHNLSVLEISERQATLEIEFIVSNPNFKSVMLQRLKYTVFHDDTRIVAGEVGSSPTGFVDTSNYYLILNERPVTLGEKFIVKNTGDAELWEKLEMSLAEGKIALNWRITVDAFSNLSSLTSGQENIASFEFTK
uniref:Uncharacterized protein n=1 Tax=uncultured marine thaumarchaeote AD1000_25_B10 TaxID=1455903 RepID=A0A075FMA5_9ARCH|nr:hypothetical protein [uncultured marine thaumarchaeote AD1000_25_B10]